jgi:hypothetical protein
MVSIPHDTAHPLVDHQLGICEWGLSKREEFAKAAMQGFCGAPNQMDWNATQIAIYAVIQADALIEALNKSKLDLDRAHE